MSIKRFTALSAFASRKKIEVKNPDDKFSNYFGSKVFSDEVMKSYVSGSIYKTFKEHISEKKTVNPDLADQIASGLKNWALSQGATHYSHWFQPMTGSTAEKHVSFYGNAFGQNIEGFSGKDLIQQELEIDDERRSGGRATFEARGYTAWDITSPAFIMEVGTGKTLCIPTVYISYTGEALDYKAPLIKSLKYLENAAYFICQYFDRNITKVIPTLGWEQEYFLIDSSVYYAREDLVMTGRTVQGRRPAKGQLLDDHYFGAIPERVYSFMRDFEIEAFKLGIPLRTRHNEMAPSQFECAHMYEELNLAVDHNLLLMDVMDRVSSKHKLKVLLHEKPFKNLNGSSKHTNWSLMTDAGKNLLSPGSTPRTNLQFLTFFINTIAAINNHERLLRSSFLSAGNELRLGNNEAPPHILSIYIGPRLKEVLNIIEKNIDEDTFDEQENLALRLELHNHIPKILLDNTDQNRTSPIAFTGNKFELRTVGSSENCGAPMIIWNAIVGDQLKKFKKEVDALIKQGDYKDVAILKVLRRILLKNKRILFDGDNTSEEWVKEAKKRGLSYVDNLPEALEEMSSSTAIEVFKNANVFNKQEIEVRSEILLKNYAQSIQIESRVLGDLAINKIVPCAVNYQSRLLNNIKLQKECGLDKKLHKNQLKLIENISLHMDKCVELEEKMRLLRIKIGQEKSVKQKAIAFNQQIRPMMDTLRDSCEHLEVFCDDEGWPLPKYYEMLITK